MQVCIATLDRRILQFGESLASLPDSVVEELDATMAERLLEAITQPNSGLILSADHATLSLLPPPPPPPPPPPSLPEQLATAIAAVADTGTVADIKHAVLGVLQAAG